MLCGSSPLKDVAIRAIKAKKFGARDVSMMAEGEAKEAVEEVEKVVKLKAKDMAGVIAPFPDVFDPLGFATDCSEGKLLFYREVELKHGRVGMLAALGFLVGEKFHPLFGGDIDVPSYVAFQQTPLQTFWPAVVAAIAIPEIFSVFTFENPGEGETWAIKKGRIPGDLGFDPLGLKPSDPTELKEMQTKELNNGRLAMLAAAGMIAQELATGTKLLA
jgi:hypothetical protein